MATKRGASKNLLTSTFLIIAAVNVGQRVLRATHSRGGSIVSGAVSLKVIADSAGTSICLFPVNAPPASPAPAPTRAPMPAPLPPPAIPPISAPPAAPPPVVAAVLLPLPLAVFPSTLVWIGYLCPATEML